MNHDTSARNKKQMEKEHEPLSESIEHAVKLTSSEIANLWSQYMECLQD